jgi:hypothetical protein
MSFFDRSIILANSFSLPGAPNRSEYQVVSAEVQAGEETFKDLQCNSCHVIDKIAFIKDDNILPDEERDHLERRTKSLALSGGVLYN